MTEREFVKRVNDMALSVYMNGGEAEVLIIPDDTEIDEPFGIMHAVGVGGIKMLQVETPYGDIHVVRDKWCPKDKWYLVDWLTVERIYHQTARDCLFFPMGRNEKGIWERLDG